MKNQTLYFHLVTFSKNMEEQSLTFAMFSQLYIISILWNITIFIVIFLDEHLQTPMYFFLRNLSFVDLFYTTVSLPKVLDVILTGDNRIYRYVAICHPLHYVLLMDRRCLQLVASCWIIGFSNSILVTIFASTLNFCRTRIINYMFCDIRILTMLSCGNKKKFEMLIYLEVFLFGLCPFSLILISYSKIISKLTHIRSSGQRNKGFSTCMSHLVVLLLFYGSLFGVYMRPPTEKSKKIDIILSLFYLAVTPTLNPLIYSLRNKDIKDAIRKSIKN